MEEKKDNIEILENEEKELPKKKVKKENKEIQKLKEENALLNDKVLRISAEMQNMKRRHDEELQSIYKYDGEDFIKKILPIIDNFERAIGMDDDNLDDEVSKFLKGFKMIYSDLYNILKDSGINEINSLDKEFDPMTMNAVFTEHVDGKEAGIVLDVMQKGYMYKDKVIRPEMVKVSE